MQSDILKTIRKSACVAPILAVRDIQASFDYYVEILQFEKQWDWGEPPGFGCVALGDVEIFFCQDCQGHPGTWLSVFIDQVDAYAAIIEAKGADIAMPLTDEPWGVREMHVRDPDGHILRIGTGLDTADDLDGNRP